jgi:hypothetical protein
VKRRVRSDEEWLQEQLLRAAEEVRAPRGFADRVMSAVYREALAGPSARPAAQGASATVSRLYRRLALSFMISAAVLAVSLLVPRGAYPTLIGSAAGAALGAGPSTAVQSALTGAAGTVQSALGEKLIVGGQQ